MSLIQSPQISTSGLVFYYDMNNTQKSWRGKPTTNFIYTQNARNDATYASYSATASGTWNAKHPDAIRVYNDLGSEISAYSNTGVTDWTNTYHAIWTLDPILKRPVVTMRDYDGNWKAKSFGTGQTMTSMGLTTGNTYTISWLQWTDDIAKSTNAGLYGLSTGGSNNFHDGLSNSFATSYNTQPYTWQRVYATFTVSAAWNLSAGLTCYMYGHYIKHGTLRIADVQLEVGTPSGFSKSQNRTNAQSILDITENNTITATSLTYDSNGSFRFFGSNYIDASVTPLSLYNLNVWLYNDYTIPGNDTAIGGVVTSYQSLINFNRQTTQGINLGGWTGSATNESVHIWSNSSTNSGFNGMTYIRDQIPVGWHNFQFNWNGSTYDIWVDGIKRTTYSSNFGHATLQPLNAIRIGGDVAQSYYFVGRIPSVSIYNRQLTDAEVEQNFNALRRRYGL